MSDPKLKYRLFILIFFISGFAGIIYESVWSQYLRILTGHAAFARTLTLVIFMGGLAIGSWFAGKISSRIKNLLLFYAFTEAAIGLLAFLFHPSFVLVENVLSAKIFPSLDSVFTSNILMWLFAALITLPQSVLLGATFPLLTGGIVRMCKKNKGRRIAQLYFVNSLGASFGILIAGFCLIPDFGLPGALISAGLLNFLIAGITVLFSKNTSIKPFAVQKKFKNELPKGKNTIYKLILIIALFTGLSSFIYEIGWLRMLCLVLGSSVHAFEIMLSAFIFGLAFGSYFIKFRIDRIKNLLWTLGKVQIWMGLFAILSLIFYNRIFNLMAFLLEALSRNEQGYVLFNFFSHFIALLIMLPATLCAGMALPLLIQVLQNRGHGEAVIGKVYAADTAGGILGVIIAIQFLMPVAGLKNLIITGAAIDIIIGLLLFWKARDNISVKKFLWLPVVLFIILIFSIIFIHPDPLKMASGVYRYGKINEDNKMLFQKDGKTSTVAVYETKNGNIVLSINGKPDASINRYRQVSGDEATQILLSAFPLAIEDSVRNIAIIGLGSGKTAHIALTDFGVQRVDVVEIEPAVIEASKYFEEYVENIFVDPRCNIVVADARTFFNISKIKYDLIISEPSNPWMSGIASLFSTQFYQEVSSSLNEEGLFVQWLHLYEMDIKLIATVVNAFSLYFDDYFLYFLDDGDMALIGKKSGKLKAPSGRIFQNPEMSVELKRLGIVGLDDLKIRFIGNKEILDPLFGSLSGDANNDFYPVLEYEAPAARFYFRTANDLKDIIFYPVPTLNILLNRQIPDTFQIGPNYPFNIAEKYKNAKAFSKYFQALAVNNIPEITNLDEYNLMIANNIRMINFISDRDLLRRSVEPFLMPLAEAVIPYLSPDELTEIWDFIIASENFSLLTEKVRMMVKLYKAVGNNQFEEVIKITEILLSKENILQTSENEYLFTSGMLAYYKTGRLQKAMDLWQRYPDQTNPPIQLLLLGKLIERETSRKFSLSYP